MMTDKERKVAVKRVIEEKPGIHHTLLCDKIVKGGIGAKKTAERTIQQLFNDREIVSFRAEGKKCYMLASDEAYEGDLVTMFERRAEALKKKLDGTAKEMPKHSYEAQQHLYDGMCGRMEETIAESDRWVKQLDEEQRYDHKEIGSDIRKLLKDTKIDDGRRHKIRVYSERVVSELESLERERDEKAKRKRTMRVSAEKKRLSEEIKSTWERMQVLYGDTLQLEHALRDLQSLDIKYWYDNTDVGRSCSYLDSLLKESAERAGEMSRLAQKLKRLAARDGIAMQVGPIDESISVIGNGLDALEGAIKGIETTGIQHDHIAWLDKALSEVESHLK